jgi:hypothetical protein
MKLSLLNVTLGWSLALVLVSSTGCQSTVRVTDTAQSGSQQLLLNSSFDAVVRCIDFQPLAERLVYFDAASLGDAVEPYVVYRIREAMIVSGVRLAESREEAEIIVEAGLAAYGTDSNSNTFGLTETDQLPEINLWIGETQYGVSRLSLFAFERHSGALVWQSGPMRADTYQRSRKVLGLGPVYDGNIEHPAKRIRRINAGRRAR